MLRTAFLLLPDFLLIVAGFLICRHTALDRVVWGGVERLVYWLLFPVLLFVSIVRSPLDPAATLGLATGGVLTVAVGIGLATALRTLPGVDAHRQADDARRLGLELRAEPVPVDEMGPDQRGDQRDDEGNRQSEQRRLHGVSP